MAKGKKTGGRDFEPGRKPEPGKEGGRPLIPEDLKDVRKMTQDEAERLITKFMTLSKAELETIINDPLTPRMHVLVCKIIEKGVEFGDTQRMEFLFNRTIGRVLDKIQVSTVSPFVIKKPDGTVLIGAKEDEDA